MSKGIKDQIDISKSLKSKDFKTAREFIDDKFNISKDGKKHPKDTFREKGISARMEVFASKLVVDSEGLFLTDETPDSKHKTKLNDGKVTFGGVIGENMPEWFKFLEKSEGFQPLNLTDEHGNDLLRDVNNKAQKKGGGFYNKDIERFVKEVLLDLYFIGANVKDLHPSFQKQYFDFGMFKGPGAASWILDNAARKLEFVKAGGDHKDYVPTPHPGPGDAAGGFDDPEYIKGKAYTRTDGSVAKKGSLTAEQYAEDRKYYVSKPGTKTNPINPEIVARINKVASGEGVSKSVRNANIKQLNDYYIEFRKLSHELDFGFDEAVLAHYKDNPQDNPFIQKQDSEGKKLATFVNGERVIVEWGDHRDDAFGGHPKRRRQWENGFTNRLKQFSKNSFEAEITAEARQREFKMDFGSNKASGKTKVPEITEVGAPFEPSGKEGAAEHDRYVTFFRPQARAIDKATDTEFARLQAEAEKTRTEKGKKVVVLVVGHSSKHDPDSYRHSKTKGKGRDPEFNIAMEQGAMVTYPGYTEDWLVDEKGKQIKGILSESIYNTEMAGQMIPELAKQGFAVIVERREFGIIKNDVAAHHSVHKPIREAVKKYGAKKEDVLVAELHFDWKPGGKLGPGFIIPKPGNKHVKGSLAAAEEFRASMYNNPDLKPGPGEDYYGDKIAKGTFEGQDNILTNWERGAAQKAEYPYVILETETGASKLGSKKLVEHQEDFAKVYAQGAVAAFARRAKEKEVKRELTAEELAVIREEAYKDKPQAQQVPQTEEQAVEEPSSDVPESEPPKAKKQVPSTEEKKPEYFLLTRATGSSKNEKGNTVIHQDLVIVEFDGKTAKELISVPANSGGQKNGFMPGLKDSVTDDFSGKADNLGEFAGLANAAYIIQSNASDKQKEKIGFEDREDQIKLSTRDGKGYRVPGGRGFFLRLITPDYIDRGVHKDNLAGSGALGIHIDGPGKGGKAGDGTNGGTGIHAVNEKGRATEKYAKDFIKAWNKIPVDSRPTQYITLKESTSSMSFAQIVEKAKDAKREQEQAKVVEKKDEKADGATSKDDKVIVADSPKAINPRTVKVKGNDFYKEMSEIGQLKRGHDSPLVPVLISKLEKYAGMTFKGDANSTLYNEKVDSFCEAFHDKLKIADRNKGDRIFGATATSVLQALEEAGGLDKDGKIPEEAMEVIGKFQRWKEPNAKVQFYGGNGPRKGTFENPSLVERVLMAKEGLHNVNPKTGFSHPEKIGDGKVTIGYGNTYWKGRPVTMNHPPISKRESYNRLQHLLEKDMWPTVVRKLGSKTLSEVPEYMKDAALIFKYNIGLNMNLYGYADAMKKGDINAVEDALLAQCVAGNGNKALEKGLKRSREFDVLLHRGKFAEAAEYFMNWHGVDIGHELEGYRADSALASSDRKVGKDKKSIPAYDSEKQYFKFYAGKNPDVENLDSDTYQKTNFACYLFELEHGKKPILTSGSRDALRNAEATYYLMNPKSIALYSNRKMKDGIDEDGNVVKSQTAREIMQDAYAAAEKAGDKRSDRIEAIAQVFQKNIDDGEKYGTYVMGHMNHTKIDVTGRNMTKAEKASFRHICEDVIGGKAIYHYGHFDISFKGEFDAEKFQSNPKVLAFLGLDPKPIEAEKDAALVAQAEPPKQPAEPAPKEEAALIAQAQQEEKSSEVRKGETILVAEKDARHGNGKIHLNIQPTSDDIGHGVISDKKLAPAITSSDKKAIAQSFFPGLKIHHIDRNGNIYSRQHGMGSAIGSFINDGEDIYITNKSLRPKYNGGKSVIRDAFAVASQQEKQGSGETLVAENNDDKAASAEKVGADKKEIVATDKKSVAQSLFPSLNIVTVHRNHIYITKPGEREAIGSFVENDKGEFVDIYITDSKFRKYNDGDAMIKDAFAKSAKIARASDGDGEDKETKTQTSKIKQTFEDLGVEFAVNTRSKPTIPDIDPELANHQPAMV